jgi:hypothetical protein
MTPRPVDFSVRYDWRAGALPRPAYWEYTIWIRPAGEGKIVLTPDYPTPEIPIWTDWFSIAPNQMDWLYDVMLERELPAVDWAGAGDTMPAIGAASEWLKVRVAGREIEIPAVVAPAHRGAAGQICGAVRALVPPQTWERLQTRRDQYVAAYRPK